MDSNVEKPNLFAILREDVSAKLVDQLLAEQRDIGLFMKVSLAEWEELSISHPELSHYIATTAYEVSKGDPLQRERIAASLLGLFRMIDEDILGKVANRLQQIVPVETQVLKSIETTAEYDDGEVQRPAA